MGHQVATDKGLALPATVGASFALACLFAAVSVVSLHPGEGVQRPVFSQTIYLALRGRPLSFAPSREFVGMVDKVKLRELLLLVPPRWDVYRSSNVLHALRLWGVAYAREDVPIVPNSQLPLVLSGDEMLSSLLEAAAPQNLSFGSPPLLFESRYGVTVRSPGKVGGTDAGLQHVDQLLALMGELWVSSATPVQTADGSKHALAEVIRDAAARFHPSQELEWTTIAFCYWLPPQTRWMNHFGDETTFDDLARLLTARRHGEGACHGAHVPYAMVHLLRADEQHPILSEHARQDVKAWLVRACQLLESNQYRSGGWNDDWGNPRTVPNKEAELGYDALIATGHHLEWIALAPPECRPSRRAIAGAVRYLIDYIPPHEPPTIARTYGPFSHALRALTLLANEEPLSLLQSDSLTESR